MVKITLRAIRTLRELNPDNRRESAARRRGLRGSRGKACRRARTWARRCCSNSALTGSGFTTPDEIMAEIATRRLVQHLNRAGFVVMKRAPMSGGTPHRAKCSLSYRLRVSRGRPAFYVEIRIASRRAINER
jgi:hypothetical protein